MPTESAREALSILRDGATFQWYVIPLLLIVVYIYANEVERRNWSVFFGGLAFWLMDWFNEIWNALVFHATDYAPMWAAPGKTAYLLLIGLNIEICFMFAVMGVVTCKLLPQSTALKIWRIPNRLLLAVISSVLCVLVEIWLNSIGALTWDYGWWSAISPLPILLIGYLPFFLVAYWVHDLPTVRQKVRAVGVLALIDVLGLLIFGVFLGWI